MTGPLLGIRVLDITQYQSGPFCGQILADMGAEVIKVENPKGDIARRIAPYTNGESLFFAMYNRNKKSITLNLRQPEGVSIFKRLAEKADVVLENFRPGVMAAIGIDYERLSQRNPGLIMVSISGFGQQGPNAKRAAFDMVVQAMGGVMSLNGEPDGPPLKSAISVGDYSGGFYATIGTLLALFHRQRTGQGQSVDVALLDSTVSLLEYFVSEYLALGSVPPRTGNRRTSTYPNNIYRASDGYVYIAAGPYELWARLARAICREDLLADPRFIEGPQRAAYAHVLDEAVEAWTSQRSLAEIDKVFQQAGVPYGPVRGIPEVATDPSLRERQMIVEVEHPIAGKIPLLGTPIKLSHTPGGVEQAHPTLGQHNQEIYGGLLGLTVEELATLRNQGAL